MRYLNLDDYSDMIHLLQLYSAESASYREGNAQMRQVSGLTTQYFMSREHVIKMATWALDQGLIDRTTAKRLLAAALDHRWKDKAAEQERLWRPKD